MCFHFYSVAHFWSDISFFFFSLSRLLALLLTKSDLVPIVGKTEDTQKCESGGRKVTTKGVHGGDVSNGREKW